MPFLSVIIPVLNEGPSLRVSSPQLAALRSRGAEIIIVDGGSDDDTKGVARACVDLVLDAPRGRASQMNAGANRARGEVLLFLHADTQLPADAPQLIEHALQRSARVWGRFDVTLVPSSALLRLVSWSMNMRSRLSG